MTQGIYCIENVLSKRKYFGSSKNVEKRLKDHRKNLEKNSHINLQLQRSFNKHGAEAFKFYLIEKTNFLTKEELQKYEQIFIDNNRGGFNMAPANGGDTLSNHPNRLVIREKILRSHRRVINQLSKEERRKKWGKSGAANPNWKNGGVSAKLCPICNSRRIAAASSSCESCRVRSYNNNPFFGRHHTEETKQKLRERDYSWIKDIPPENLSYTKKYQIRYSNGDVKEVYGLKAIATEFNVSITNVHSVIARTKKGNAPRRGAFAGIIITQLN